MGQGQVCPIDAKVTAITEFPKPSNKCELRCFLSMAGYYRRFFRNFASLVAPLTDLLRPSQTFSWTPACEHAFTGVKDLLCYAPVLSTPGYDRSFSLEVDASAVGAGAVLLQSSEVNIKKPVCYFSKKFSRAQYKYSTIEKEVLALLWAVNHFEVYLGGSTFPVKVYTDHNPLVFLNRMYNTNQRLMRWSLALQELNLEIVHKQGSENVVADALSRAHSAENV